MAGNADWIDLLEDIADLLDRYRYEKFGELAGAENARLRNNVQDLQDVLFQLRNQNLERAVTQPGTDLDRAKFVLASVRQVLRVSIDVNRIQELSAAISDFAQAARNDPDSVADESLSRVAALLPGGPGTHNY